MSDQYGDIFKMEFDFFKHLTTLSTGVIVILTAFLDNVAQTVAARGGSWLFLSLLSFVLCITGSCFSMYSIILERLHQSAFETEGRPLVRPFLWTIPNFKRTCYTVKFMSMWLFLLGVVMLVVFVLVGL